MLRKNKNAIIYAAGGSIAGAVVRAFAREGATVCLVGRTLDTLDKVAKELS
jgi:3-oxoacyl-[acyl-carrier protein] reductase